MSLKDRILNFFHGEEEGPEVCDPDPEFDERLEQLENAQQEVGTRLKALGTTVDVHVLRTEAFDRFTVEVETEKDQE